MQDKTVNLNLDLNAPPAILHVTQGDTAWRWHFPVWLDGLRWSIPTGAQAILKGLKPDGHVFAYSGSISSNEVVVDCALQMTICAGPVGCTLIIMDTAGKRLHVARIALLVAADPEATFDVASDSALPAYAEVLDGISELLELASTIPDDLPGYITNNVDAWLAAHIDPSTGYALDDTLTLSNAAAPAGKVGDLKSALNVNGAAFGIVNILSENDADTYRGISVTKSIGYLKFAGTATATARFKLSGDIDHAVSAKDQWLTERLPVIAGRKYRLMTTILGGTYSGRGSPQIAIIDGSGNTTATTFIADHGTMNSGLVASDEFTATTTNCAHVQIVFATDSVLTDLILSVVLYDAENADTYLSNSTYLATQISNETQNQNAAVGFYNEVPTITSTGTTLTVSVPANVRGYNKEGTLTNNTSAAVYQLATNMCLVFYSDTRVFDVVEATSLGSLEHPYIVCVYNSRGIPIGPWAYHYNTGVLQSEIDTLNGVLPNYYFTDDYLTNKVTAINSIGCDLSRQAMRMFFITDFHYDENACISPVIVNYLKNKTGIRNVVFNGDYYTKDLDSKIGGYDRLTEFLALSLTVEDGANTYYISGNHEYNDPSGQSSSLRLSQDAVYQLLNEPKHYDIVSLDKTNSFYFDDDSTKIRVYCIDCDYASAISLDARKSIFTSLLDIPADYAVLICSHTGTTASNGVVSGLTGRFAQIMSVFAALNDGVSITVNLGSDYTYDFTGKQRVFIGALTGHQHADGYYIYNDRFPVILTTCDAYAATQYPTDHGRTKGTITEQAFDVVQVDVASKRIYCTRIGYGNDRVFSFGEAMAGLIT